MLDLTDKQEKETIAKLGKKYLTISETKGKNFIRVEPSSDVKFQMIPNAVRNRVMYITGASGSGKSYYLRNYAKQYMEKYKGNRIWLFSAIPDNTDFKNVKAKQLNPSKMATLEMNKVVEALANSLVIFDDIDVMNKVDRATTYSILNRILEVGRHWNTFCAISNHLATGLDLRRVLNEAGSITFFINNYNKSLRYLLENYLGLEKESIQRIKRSKSRWTTIFKHYPMVVMDEFSAYHPNQVDVEDDIKEEENVDNQVISKGLSCEYCGKTFGRRSTKSKHIKSHCPVLKKKNIDALIKNLEK